MLKVHEIFHSIQGEGPFSGRPAVFLRLAGCVKPYCPFCDTPEALGDGKFMALAEIVSAIKAYPCSFVVITGGEPFLQWEDGLAELEKILLSHGMEVQYESSGKAGLPEETGGKIVLSPKPGNWPVPEALSGVFALKVLWDEKNSAKILRMISETGFPAEKIWLMALGASKEEQLSQMPVLWEVCRVHGYHFSPRLHILAFDRKPGI